MSTFAFAPLSRTLPYWPKELFGDPGGLLDEIGITDFNVVSDDQTLEFTGTAAWLEEIEFKIPGLDSVSIAFLSTGGFTQIQFELQVEPAFELTLVNLNAALRIRSEFLRPVQQDASGKWVLTLDAQGDPVPAEVTLSGVNLVVSAEGDVSVAGAPAFKLSPVEFGDSGIVLDISEIELYLSGQETPPTGAQAGFKGIAITQAKLYLSGGLAVSGIPTVTFTDLLIGSSGFSGRIEANWTSSTGQGTLFGLEFLVTSLDFTFVQNVPTDATFSGQLKLPFFDQPVGVDISVAVDGGLSIALSSTQPAGAAWSSGLITFEKSGVLRAELDSLGFELRDGVFLAKLSGKLTPLVADVNWPSFDIKELSIDSKGNVQLTGGWIPLPTSYSIDFYGATLEITKFGMGQTKDGLKFIGMSGDVELVKGMPAGASVEGLRIAWDKNNVVSVSFNGIGLKFETPALSFNGHVSYTSDGVNHQFKGDLEIDLYALELTLTGKAVFGTSGPDHTKYFAIYLDGEFGTGIPLFATGLAIYGFEGLLAVNYAPAKPNTMLWYSVNHANSFFHKPQIGMTDIASKWQVDAGTFAIGAGVQLATYSDDGYSFNGKFLLLVLLPGPVVMIDGSAAFLRDRDDQTEPPFNGLIVLDNRAGYFLIGLDVRWEKDETGDVADISGGMEVYFNFRDPRLWHLYLGEKDPMAARIQAKFAKAFTANAYFMLTASNLAVGVWIGTSQHYNWGPVGADMEAWLSADAEVNFKPSHFHAGIEFYGNFAIKVFKFKLSLTLDASLAADVAKPFHIVGQLTITISTWIKDFHIHMQLEWGPRINPPVLQGVPELEPVQCWGIVHSKSANDWQLGSRGTSLGATGTIVPVDANPYFTFAFPMYDKCGVGVNSNGKTAPVMIGDPSPNGSGSALANYSLTGITLYKGTTLVAQCPLPAGPTTVQTIYGVWVPSASGTSAPGAGGQNKLKLWSANPLDFADKAASWNPWLSSNLPGYPCPDATPETICMNFEDLVVGQELYGSGWHTPAMDFQLAWSDAGPHPIVPVPVAVFSGPGLTLDRGLLFPAAAPRKSYRAYVSNSGDNTVSLVDLATLKVIATIPAGEQPRQVVLSRDGKTAYVCNQNDNTVIAIATATNQRVGAPLAAIKQPDSITLTLDGTLALVPSGTDPAMAVIDLHTFKVKTTVNLPAVANQVVLSLDGTKLYIMHGPAGTISVLDANSFKLLTTVVATGGPAAMVIHPSLPRAWVSFPSLGTVRLFNTGSDEFTALETPTGTWARDLALSQDGARLYVGNLQGSTVSVLDTGTLDVLATIATPSPAGLQMTPDGASLLVANYFNNTIAVIDARQNQVVAQNVAAGKGSDSFAVLETPPQTAYRAFVSEESANALNVLDLQTRQSLASIPVGHTPRFVALTSDGKRVSVGNGIDGSLMVFDATTYAPVGGPISIIKEPSSIAFSPDGKRAYVPSAVESNMSVVDLTTLTVSTTFPLSAPVQCVVLSREGGKGYLIHVGGPVSVFTTAPLAISKVVPAQAAPQYMSLHPRLSSAFVSCPAEGTVREFDTSSDQYTGRVVTTGKWAQNLCYSPDGSRLYVCNFQGNTISVVDTAAGQVLANIPVANGPKSLVCPGDGSLLFIANYTGDVTTIDTATNRILGDPIPNPGFPNSLVVVGTPKQEVPFRPVPVEVTIDVPPGSSSVEVTWSGGNAPLQGTVTLPAQPAAQVVAATAPGKLVLDVAVLDPTGTGLAQSGINQIRLHSDTAWTLVRVCVKRPPFVNGLADQQALHSASQQNLNVWANPTFLLEPEQEYTVSLAWSADIKGLNDLSNWSESFNGTTDVKFKTALPPALGTVSDPSATSKAKGLDDLSLYVRTTIPVTQPANEQVVVLTNVFCGYDVTVKFNENYVDQLYQMAGKDLDLFLFDRNNKPVTDALGQLIITEDAWSNAPTLTLTDTQALWIEMFNANTCKLGPIDLTTIPTSKVLSANDAHVLSPDSVYDARLVPQLLHELKNAGTTWTTDASLNAQIYSPGPLPAWTDYRVSVLASLDATNPVGILFGYTGDASYYEFVIDPRGKRRRLTQVTTSSNTLWEDYYLYNAAHDNPSRIRIEAVGSQILISQNGTVLCTLTVAAAASLTGTVGLRQQAAGPSVFNDLGVSNLSPTAPVAYHFDFTTSQFANFYHQIHSFQDQLWAVDQMTPLDLSAAVSSSTGTLPSAPLGFAVPDKEVRAYDAIAAQVLGSASAQNPPQMEVTRLEHEGAVLGWLVTNPEPFDYTRVQFSLSAASRIVARGQAPGAVKITEAQLGDTESVTVLARQQVDPTGYRVEYREMPSALAGELGSQILVQGNGPVTAGTIAGDQTWTDYRATVVCSSSVAGGIGIQFRYLDAQNFYAFTYDFTTGVQAIIKTVAGVTTTLASTTGDPAPGTPAPLLQLTVSLLGSQITCYRAGKNVLQFTDPKSTFPAGGAGAFSGSNSSATFESFEAHRLPNESYALLQGQFSTATMTGGQAATDGSGLTLYAIGAALYADAILRVRMPAMSGDTVGVFVRYQDLNNHYRALFTKTGNRVERVQGGTITVLWSSPPATLANQQYEIAISMLGSALHLFIDSAPACEIADPSFASGNTGLCTTTPTFAVSQLVVYPPQFAFANWTVEDDFQTFSTDSWTLVDEGDQGGPSSWQVSSGLLTQTSAIYDSSLNLIGQRGTLALNKNADPADSRLVTQLLTLNSGAIGVVFGYQDANNFYRLSMNATTNVAEQYRRLVSCVNGRITVLWSDSAAFQAGRQYVLTLDLIDDYATAWVDGVKIFQCSLAVPVTGSFGLYCCNNNGASFGNFRVGTAAWIPYYTFGRELPLSTGNRVTIEPVVVSAPNKRTSMRLAAELDDPAIKRLPPAGVHLRILAPDQTVQHGREFVPALDYTGTIPFQALRKADGTGIFLAPVGSMAPGQTIKMSFVYHRDNGAVAFTDVGEPGDEVVSIDLPTDSENTILLSHLRVAQLVDGGNWKTTIVLANTDSAPAQFTAMFHQADGTPLALPLVGSGAVTQYSGLIPVGGSQTIQTQGLSSVLLQGWAEVVTANSISATAIIRQSIAAVGSEASVEARARGANHFLLPFNNSSGLITAVAALNPDPTEAAIVSVIFRDGNGQLISNESLTIAANSRQAIVLATQFPAVAGKSGVAELLSTRLGISLLSLRFTSTGAFTSIEPIAVDSLPVPGSSGTIAQIADGAGWQTSIILVNTGSAPAPFSLTLMQPDGTPWNLPITLADGAVLTDPIPVGGSRIIETSGVATVLSQGWGQVATSGSIAGIAIFRQTLSTGHDSEAAVPLISAKMQRFIVPFDNTQGFVTAVALANQNASQATTISVTLRDQDGKLLGNGSIDLEPLARSAFVLPSQFPITANTQGVVAFFAANVDISALGLRVNPQGSFTSILPIVMW
jgi:YVTN family beta-propeller protein